MPMPSQAILLSLKSILLSACVAVITLSGCQTTTGMQTKNSPTHLPDTPPLQNAPNEAEYPNVTQIPTSKNEGMYPPQVDYETQPNTQSPSKTATPIDSNDVNSDGLNSAGNESDSLDNPTKITPNVQNSHNVPETGFGTVFDQEEESLAVPSNIPANENQPNEYIRPSAKTTQQILIERARQNSKTPNGRSVTIADGNDIPAFRRLMDTGVKQLRQGKLSSAQSTFTRAQRLAPQSSAVYFYLGQVALKHNQPLKAEAMARRGLVVAQDKSRKIALWQLILKSAQRQGNQRVIKEAKTALAN